MITMTEIARLTGVSQPTVSRVLNGNTSVNPEVREKVLACAREHNFQPNAMARGLVGSGTRLIGVVLTDISNSFFADLEKYMEQAARKKGYSLILFNSDYDREKEKHCLDVMRRYRVDGLIIVPVAEKDETFGEEIRALEIPAVSITRETEELDCVYIEHAEAGAQVAEHLRRIGCEHYIFVGTTRDKKYQGFVEKMKEQDPDFEQKLTFIETKDSQKIEDILARHFETHPGKTGIFAYNDRRAVQIHGLLQKLVIPMPERAALVGFDNTYTCEYLYPALSSISQPNLQMAEEAVNILIEKIEQSEEKERVAHPMQAQLIIRESSEKKEERIK